jgi:lysophospholipase L1-like esterase
MKTSDASSWFSLKTPDPLRSLRARSRAECRRPAAICRALAALLALASLSLLHAEPATLPGPTGAPDTADWVEAMTRIHSRFTGTRGTFAQFGDSITYTMAFWAPLAYEARNMTAEGAQAHERVKRHMKPECWREWKGAEFGSQGSMTIRWAHENVDRWLAKLNPEVAVILFGSNDVGLMDTAEYEARTRSVVQRCLTNGTVVILTTMPPRSGRVEKSRQFAEAARRLARELKVPLVDYAAEILTRRPDDWDGSLPQFKGAPGDEYQVPTLIARDGVHPSNPKRWVSDYSDEGLRQNGYTLRNFLTLRAYAEVISNKVLAPEAR